MGVPEVVGLLLATVAALAAVGAWLVAVSAREEAARSAAAAERSAVAGERQADEVQHANYLARTPKIELSSEGTVQRGLELYLCSDTDLDVLRLEVLREQTGSPDRRDLLGGSKYMTPHQLSMDHVPDVHVKGNATNTLTIERVRAGQRYWITAWWPENQGRPRRAKASFRMQATAGSDEWVLLADIDVELAWRY